MPSSAEIESRLRDAAERVARLVGERPHPIVLIDGRSGAGKSTLAALLAQLLDAQVLALDSVYPGWDGLRAGADAVIEGVLRPRSLGLTGRWVRWDWVRDEPAEPHDVDPRSTLIVEGSGILTPISAAFADASVWVDSPSRSRRQRALDRDGDTYRPHWDRWAAQEEAHLASHRPDRLATVTVRVP